VGYILFNSVSQTAM